MAKRDKAEIERERLAAARRHKKKWKEPEDALLILNLHFEAHSFTRTSHHASATLEVPIKGGEAYFTVSASDKTYAGALRRVLEKIEGARWFHHMRDRGVRFKVTGPLEEVYRGYL